MKTPRPPPVPPAAPLLLSAGVMPLSAPVRKCIKEAQIETEDQTKNRCGCNVEFWALAITAKRAHNFEFQWGA